MNFIKRIYKKFNLPYEEVLIQQVRDKTMCLKEALRSLIKISQQVRDKNLKGDIVECGVCNGGTAALLASIIKLEDRHLWLYDSFQGMPTTTDQDGPEASKWVGQCVGSEQSVKEALQQLNVPIGKTKICKGWFEDTFSKQTPEKIALLHIDADWYSSVKLCLDTFYDKVVDGGYIVLDDFGCWEGCREAFYDFCSDRNIKPLIERAGPYQAFWIKGVTHHRSKSMT